MYVRRVEGKETTFGTSGALWRDALVMYDRETHSLWSQVTATAIAGARKGTELQEIPSVVMTWKEWKTLHPETLVLRKPRLSGSPYDMYYQDPKRLGPTRHAEADPRLPGKDLVIGVKAGGKTAAVPLARLEKEGAVNDFAGDTPVVWVRLGGQAAAAFVRQVKGKLLEMDLKEGAGLVDGATGSVFDPESGRGTAGPLAGEVLKRLPATRVYWYSWTAFHPDTDLIRN